MFELLTASFAAKNFLLRDDWKKRANFFKKSEVLRKLDNTSFLRAVSLLVYGSCKRGDILRLDVEDYKRVANKVQDGFVKAAEFLNKQKILQCNRCTIPNSTCSTCCDSDKFG